MLNEPNSVLTLKRSLANGQEITLQVIVQQANEAKIADGLAWLDEQFQALQASHTYQAFNQPVGATARQRQPA